LRKHLGSHRLERKLRFLLATPAQSYKSHSKIAVATVCQPILEDHDSCRLECKHCFLLATLITKVRHSPSFDCSGKIILPSIFCKSRSKIVVANACQPVLEDHDSCRLERKHRFSLATLVTKSFIFVRLLWRGNFAKHLLNQQKSQARHSYKVSCLLLPSRAFSFWSLDAAEYQLIILRALLGLSQLENGR
jgi:hypothetical protein